MVMRGRMKMWRDCSTVRSVIRPGRRNSSSAPRRLLYTLLDQALAPTISCGCLGLQQISQDLLQHILLERAVEEDQARL